MWSRPRKPQRKPKPSASLVTASKLNEESESESVVRPSRRLSKSPVFVGKKSAYTMWIGGR